jgi:hypothetical protein
VISTVAVHLAATATSASTRLVHTAAVEMANVAAYGSLLIIQFVLCDRILFRTPPLEGVPADQSVSPRQPLREQSASRV